MTLKKTTKLNKNMIATIIFGKYGWNFIFINQKTNEYFNGRLYPCIHHPGRNESHRRA